MIIMLRVLQIISFSYCCCHLEVYYLMFKFSEVVTCPRMLFVKLLFKCTYLILCITYEMLVEFRGKPKDECHNKHLQLFGAINVR